MFQYFSVETKYVFDWSLHLNKAEVIVMKCNIVFFQEVETLLFYHGP